MVDNNVKIPSATMELYKLIQKEKFRPTSFPLPGLHTMSSNTVRTYINKGNSKGFYHIMIFIATSVDI